MNLRRMKETAYFSSAVVIVISSNICTMSKKTIYETSANIIFEDDACKEVRNTKPTITIH